MKPRKRTAHAGIHMMGFDFYVEIRFTFRPGCPASWNNFLGAWEPADPPEYEVDEISLSVDEPGNLGPAWKLSGAMFDHMAEHPAVVEAVETFEYLP